MFNSNQGGASKLNNITHQQLEIIRSKYIGQNRSLAKVNSSLLSKIAFLETKLNQLFKDYIKLKNDKVTGTHNLNSVLDELEKECVLKFGEIFDKIDDIRVENNIEPLSNISIKTSNDDNVSPDLPLVNARRKTRRRESMVIPQGEEPVLDDVQQQQQEEPIKSEADMSNGIGNRSQQHTITELSIPELDEDEFDKDEQDFLRMKENFEKQKTAIQLSNKPGRKEKKSNFKVFQDHNNNEATSTTSSMSILPKHSNSKPTLKSLPNSVDIMPSTTATTTTATTSAAAAAETTTTTTMTAEPQRPVRSRSRINYKLPSLRKKLRRPDDKLVDAVYYVEQDDLRIVDDIEEPRNKRKRRDSGRFIKISNDFLLDGEPQIKEEDVHNGDINSDCNKLSLPVSQVAVSQETILQEAKSQFPDKTAIDIPQKQTRIPLGDISNTSNNNSNISGNISGNSSHQDSNDSSIVKQEDAKIIHKKSSLSEGMSAFDFMEDEQEDLLKCNRRKTIFSNNSNSISSNDEGNKVPITMNDDERKKVNKKMRSSNIQKKKNNNNKRRYSNVY